MRNQSIPASFEPRELLVRGVNWLGDAVMTTPAMQRLREHFPKTRITLLTHEKLAQLWQHHLSLDAVITFNNGDNPWSIARRLEPHHFEAALILPNSPRSALESWLAGIPRRLGYAGRWRNWLLTQPVKYPAGQPRLRKRRVREVKRLLRGGNKAQNPAAGDPARHQIHDYLRLAAVWGCDPAPLPPKLEVSTEETQAAAASLRQLLGPNNINKDGQSTIWLGLNISAAYGPAKRWPVERFAAVAREISARDSNRVWLSFGGQTDWELCEQVARAAPGSVINLAGKTSLRQLMALLKNCRVLLTNDSGPMHVAAGLGVPAVVPFGSTSPELTGPSHPGDPRHHLLRSDAPCAPCFRRTCPIDFRCMTGITVDRVVAAIMTTLTAENKFLRTTGTTAE